MKKRFTTLAARQHKGRELDDLFAVRTIVLFPLTAPHVLMYAVVSEPRKTPTIAQAVLSANPSP